MYGIEILRKEHANILNFTNILEEKFINILAGQEDLDPDFFLRGVDFIRTYADAHHHKKEEDILFKYMLEDFGAIADKLIRSGMLVEHDLARFTTSEFEKALLLYKEDPSTKNKLDILAHGMNYAYLLRRHANKENDVLYPFAEKNMSKERLDLVDQETKVYEENFDFSNFDNFKDFLLD
ncbi:MAG: hemerythrin domain-containing protein [Bacillota bacterium]|nr:hemerythrin domain-containing protein [Bacillota bacterium]